MIIGFTGTSRGMTQEQHQAISTMFGISEPSEVHHGDCIGADATFHRLCDRFGIPIVIHPPDDTKKRANCYAFPRHPNGNNVTLLLEKPYLERNHDIVDACNALLATPGEGGEILRSGTWATIRYARKVGKPITIIYPNGDIET